MAACADWLTIDDLAPFASIDADLAAALIDDAVALAARVAPCITDDDFAYAAAAKAILRGVILRYHETGTGAVQSQTAGPYGMTVDTRQERRAMFWPSEINMLQDLCRNAADGTGAAFQIDTTPTDARAGYWSQPDTWVPL